MPTGLHMAPDYKTFNEALSRRHKSSSDGKEIYKTEKCDARAELFFCLPKPIAFLTFSPF